MSTVGQLTALDSNLNRFWLLFSTLIPCNPCNKAFHDNSMYMLCFCFLPTFKSITELACFCSKTIRIVDIKLFMMDPIQYYNGSIYTFDEGICKSSTFTSILLDSIFAASSATVCDIFKLYPLLLIFSYLFWRWPSV